MDTSRRGRFPDAFLPDVCYDQCKQFLPRARALLSAIVACDVLRSEQMIYVRLTFGAYPETHS